MTTNPVMYGAGRPPGNSGREGQGELLGESHNLLVGVVDIHLGSVEPHGEPEILRVLLESADELGRILEDQRGHLVLPSCESSQTRFPKRALLANFVISARMELGPNLVNRWLVMRLAVCRTLDGVRARWA
jgi:hypothetical protein